MISGRLLFRGGSRLRLQPVQVIGGRLRMTGRREDEALVAFEALEPGIDIGSVVFARLGSDAEIGAEESGSDFSDLS